MLIPTYRDINILGVEDDILYGLAGEAAVGFEFVPRKDVRMCAAGEVDAFTASFNRLLSVIPTGFGLQFEAEIIAEDRSEKFQASENGIPPILKEIVSTKLSSGGGASRGVKFYAYVWTPNANPLKLPMFPQIFPRRSKGHELIRSVETNSRTIKDVAQTVQASLSALGIEARALDTNELLARLRAVMLPTTSQAAAPTWSANASTRSQLAASNAENAHDHFFLDGQFHAAVSFYNLPGELYLGQLDALLESLPVGTRYVLSVLVPDQEEFLSSLKVRHARATAEATHSAGKDFEAESRGGVLDEIITRCRQQGERVYQANALIVLRSQDLPILTELKKTLVFTLREILGVGGLIEDLSHYRMFLSSFPMNGHLSPRRHILLGSTVTALAPISNAWQGSDGPGLLMSTRSRELISMDLFEGGTPRHGVIVATTGGGKSFTANMMLLSLLAQPKTRALVIDIGGSYRRVTEILGGAYFDIKIDEQFAINPLLAKSALSREDGTLDPELLGAQTSLLARFITPAPDGSGRLVIEKALERVYHDKEEPLLTDFYAALVDGPWDAGLTRAAKNLAAEFRQYVEGVYSHILARPSKIRPFESLLTVFDLAGLKEHKNLQSILVGVIAFSLNRELSDKSLRKVVIIDEGWELFADASAADLISKLYRQARKQNGAILSISQSPAEFLDSAVSPAIMANIHWAMALKMASGHERLSAFGFTDQAIDHAKSLQMVPRSYSEVLIRFGDAPSRIARISPTSTEYWIATTNAGECVRESSLRKDEGLTPIESVQSMAKKEPVLPW